MRKNRPFQKGLGTGLIVGALLLQLMINVQGTGVKQPDISAPQTGISPSPAGELTAELIKARAPSLNLQVYDKGVVLYTQEQLDKNVTTAVEAAKKEAATAPAGAKQVSVYITVGMTADNVADYLFRSGIIADRAVFQQQLAQNQLNDKIRTGLYTFTVGQPVEQIITALTTIPR